MVSTRMDTKNLLSDLMPNGFLAFPTIYIHVYSYKQWQSEERSAITCCITDFGRKKKKLG